MKQSARGSSADWQDWVALGGSLGAIVLVALGVALLVGGRWLLGAVALSGGVVATLVPVVLVRRFGRRQRAAREFMWRRLRDDLAAPGRHVEPITAPRPRFRLVRGRPPESPGLGSADERRDQDGMRRQA